MPSPSSGADGPDAGLERLDALAEVHSLQRYPLFHAARGDMLERLGRFPEAAAAFRRAATWRPTRRSAPLCTPGRASAEDAGFEPARA